MSGDTGHGCDLCLFEREKLARGGVGVEGRGGASGVNWELDDLWTRIWILPSTVIFIDRC